MEETSRATATELLPGDCGMSALDDMILTCSFLWWTALCAGDRQYWRVNESLGSAIAMMREGAD